MKETKLFLFALTKSILVLALVFFFFLDAFSQEFIKSEYGCGVRLRPRSRGKVEKALSSGTNENEIIYYTRSDSSASNSRTEATDLTNLFIDISEDGSILYLNWNGDDAPFVISRSSDPSFQQDVEVVAKESEATSIQLSPRQNKILECFDVSGKSVVSYPEQGIGYVKDPIPSVPEISSDTMWWGDTLTINSNYLDPIAKANIIPMGDRYARAESVTTMGSYGVSADFTIPDDARSFYPLIQSNGRLSDPAASYPFVNLSPRTFEYISGLTGISYAPQTGKVWIAGSGSVFELDLFRRDVENGKGVEITSFSNPLISRVSNDGRFVIVDGVNGANCVYQVDVSTGVMSVYAFTYDDSFTRSIYPKGIGFSPEGTACFIADGNNGKVVKIPVNAGPGSSTIRDNWGNRTFSFGAMPIGIDVNKGYNYVVVSSGNGYVYQITGQSSSSSLGYLGAVACSIEIDRDYSISTFSYFYYETQYVFANCYNKNQIEGNNVAYHGGTLFGNLSNGFLELDPHWAFVPYRNYPQKVLLNSSNISYPYSSPYQVSDRIIELEVCGWYNRPVKLMVIDPADLSPYAPDGGWNPTSSLPYEGNDNVGMADYGICLNSDCSDGAQVTRTVTIGSDWTKKVYLKVPERYSGNNFQVLVMKTDYSGNDLPEPRIAAATPIYTTWKRVYVERDKMFRRGGLLYSNTSVNDTSVVIYKNPDDNRWDNLSVGDKVAIFDTQNPYEGPHDEAYISEITQIGDEAPHQMLISLVTTRGGTTPYQIKKVYNASPPNPTTHYPDFSQGKCAAIGVVESNDGEINDRSTNQLNGVGSAFYDADMRSIEKTFNDGYVEFLGLRDGMSAVPYLPPSFFDGFSVGENCTTGDAKPGYDFNSWFKFGWIWFKNHGAQNYLWLGGVGTTAPLDAVNCKVCSGNNPAPQIWGLTLQSATESFVFAGAIEAYCASANQTANAIKGTTNHETGHQFYVNPLGSLGHDERCQWTYDDTLSCSTTPIPTCSVPEYGCLMNPQRERWNTEHRFDIWDLFCGWGNACSGTSPPGCCESCDVPGDGAIRHFSDTFEGDAP